MGCCTVFATIFDYQRDTFLSASTDDYVKATVAMGIEGIDRSDFVRWEPEDNRGTAIFNPDFDLSTTAAQEFFLQTCEALRTKQCDLDGCQSGSTPATLVLPGGVSCWMESFRTWYTVRSLWPHLALCQLRGSHKLVMTG